MKIRTAIFGVYMTASAVGFAVLMGFILREVRPRYVESMRRTLNDTVALFVAMLQNDLAHHDSTPTSGDLGAAWQANLAAMAKSSGGLRVYVTDACGIVAFDSANGRDVGRDYTQRPEMRAYFSKSYYPDDNASVVDGELRVTAPVKWRNSVVGFVGLARPLSTVAEAVMRARLRLAGGGLVIAAIMLAAGWWISAKVTHSLERLTAHAQAVRDGRPTKPPESRAKEIALLTQAFEEMRTSLEGKAYVERYTQTLAHEIKAPLSAIRGAAEILAEKPPPEEQTRFLANVKTESARIQQIVDRLLQLSALEARHGRLKLESVELGSIVRNVANSMKNIAAARKISLTLPEGATPRVRGESYLLGQAVGNLLQNALEFTPPSGTVALFVEQAGNRAIVAVEDSGPGIPDFALERIFERFYSLPRPDTGRKSTGLGLSITREVALLHGGEICIANRPKGGVRAELNLPLA